VRRLAIFAYSFTAAALFSVQFLSGRYLWAPSFVILALAAGAFFLRKRLPSYVLPLLLGLTLGCFSFEAWEHRVLASAEELAGRSGYVEATVLDQPYPTAYGYSVSVRVEGVKCRLFLDEAYGLTPGQRIGMEAHFRLTAEKTDDDYYLSVGLPLFGYADTEPKFLGSAEHPWLFFPAKLGIRLRENIAAAFDSESAPFLIAVLTGERGELRKDVFLYSMLRESGVLHCIAVSGMHLTFLISFLTVLLGKGRHTAIICIPVIILFMAVTGFTPTVVRAGVMQLALCGSIVLRRPYDSHSALALSAAVLTAINPWCCLNVGLMMSFASTLGLLLFSEKLDKCLPHRSGKEEHRFPSSILRYVRSSLTVSLAAMLLTMPITAFYFRQIPLLAPLTNLLILWAVTAAFGFGLLASLLGFFWPAGAVILGYPARIAVGYIALTVKFIGRLPVASLYPDNEMVALWLICAYLLLLFFRFLPGIEHRFRGFFITAAASLVLFCGLGYASYRQDELRVSVLDVEQGQCTIILRGGITVVGDCGSSNSSMNAGDIAARYLLSRGRTSVDALIISHYDADHWNGAEELIRRMKIGALYVPPPGENAAAEAMLRAAEKDGVRVVVLENEPESLVLNDIVATILPPLGGLGDNERGLITLVSLNDFDVLITGDASQETELRMMERLMLPDVEVLVAGHHGSGNSTSQRLLDTAAPDVAVISVGRNSYGLPAENTLLRLAESGAEIYRTDRSGTVEIVHKPGGN